MPQGRTRGGNAPDARTTAAGPPQAPRRRKPPRTSQIGPPAQAGRQAPTSPAAGPPRHEQAAAHTRRDDDRPRRERMRHATRHTPHTPRHGRRPRRAAATSGDDDRPRREDETRHAAHAAHAPARQTTDEQPPKGGDHDRPRTLTTAQHPDTPRRGRTRRRNGETRGDARPARETRPKGAAARNCPDLPAGTRRGGDSAPKARSTLQGTPRKRRSFPTPGLPDAAKGRKRPRKRRKKP